MALVSVLLWSLTLASVCPSSSVQPHTPENVTVGVLEDEDGPFLRVSWEPPRKADTRSGWITLIYELRVKLEEAEEWEVLKHNYNFGHRNHKLERSKRSQWQPQS